MIRLFATGTIRAWRRRHRAHRRFATLAALSDHQLRDIGLTRTGDKVASFASPYP